MIRVHTGQALFPTGRKKTLLLLALMAGSLALCAGVHAAPPRPAPLSAPALPPGLPVVDQKGLEQDKRLDRPVTVQKVGVPLDELLQSLSDPALTLDAARSCDAQKLQIRLKQKSLRVLMQSLAELLPGEWLALDDHKGYRLRLTDQAVRRRQRWWNLWMAERDKALAIQRAFVLQEMRGEIPQLAESKESNLTPELRAFEAQNNDFFKALSPALQEQLAAHANQDDFYREGGGGIGTGRDEGALLLPVSELSASARHLAQNKIMRQFTNLASEPDWSQTFITLMNGGNAVAADIALPDGRYSGLYGRGMSSFDSELLREVLTPDHAQMLRNMGYLGKQVPEGWKQLAAFQQSRVWPNDPPAKPADYNAPVWNRSDMLQRLGYAADMEYVADYYSRPGRQMSAKAKTAPLDEALPQTLNTQTALLDSSWKQMPNRDKQASAIYLIRDNRWYRSDWLEVPATTLRRWKAISLLEVEHLAPSAQAQALAQQRVRQLYDWQADVVTALSPFQIGWGLKYARYEPDADTAADFNKRETPAEHLEGTNGKPMEFRVPWGGFPFYRDVEAVFTQLRRTQFYAGLNESQRNAVLADGVDFAVLSPALQSQALYVRPKLQMYLRQHPDAPVKLRLPPNLPPGIVPRGAIMGRLEFAAPPDSP